MGLGPTSRVLSLLSEDSASQWQQAIKAVGATIAYYPTLYIAPIAITPTALARGLNNLQTADWVIVTSKHAIRHMPATWQQAIATSTVQLATMGAATAAIGQAANLIADYQVPPGGTSETLLSETCFQEAALAGQQIVIITGMGGRPLLYSTLSARASQVIEWPVYQRVPHTNIMLDLAQLQSLRINTLLLTSGASYEALKQGVADDVIAYLKTCSVFVLSERLKQYALQQGFSKVECLFQYRK